MRWVFLLLLCVGAPGIAERWKIQYFFDEDRTHLEIEDLVFPSAQRGVAVGIVVNDYEGKFTKNIALVTSDGGENWAQIPLKERPRSLFFLNENSGSMVTDDSFSFPSEA